MINISIHAPLAGCDACSRINLFPDSYFNPRTPCGVRRSSTPATYQPYHNFNPRTPCGVRRPEFETATKAAKISIHAPLAGCDLPIPVCRTVDTFQSTHPLRGATCCQEHNKECQRISIHAPLAGCDFVGADQIGVLGAISIHAPLAGCDSKNAQKLLRIFAATDKTQDISDRTLPVKVFRPMRSMMETVRFRCEPPHKTMYAHNSHYTISGSSGK